MTNNFSNSASGFVDEVEKFSRTNLNKKAELLRIYEESIKTEKEKTFEDLAFTAKYLRGLMRVMQDGASNPGSGFPAWSAGLEGANGAGRATHHAGG